MLWNNTFQVRTQEQASLRCKSLWDINKTVISQGSLLLGSNLESVFHSIIFFPHHPRIIYYNKAGWKCRHICLHKQSTHTCIVSIRMRPMSGTKSTYYNHVPPSAPETRETNIILVPPFIYYEIPRILKTLCTAITRFRRQIPSHDPCFSSLLHVGESTD
jgi:hypothetical protein